MDFTALYFPGTSPSMVLVETLLLLHETVCWYQPTEGLAMGELEPLAQRGLVKATVPAPLGAERQRFEATLRDLLAHGQEYKGAYLAAMAAAAEPGRSTPGWDIVAGLTNRQLEADRELWQARLLLQLQAILEQQEEEVSQGLAALAAGKTALLRALRGDAQGAPAVRPAERATLSPARVEQLARAWARLFFADQSTCRPLVLATDLEGAAALLLADCERYCKKGSQAVLALALPTLAALAMDDFIAQLATFRQHAAPLLLELRQTLVDMAQAPGDELPAGAAARLPALATRWEEEVAACFGDVAGERGAALVIHRLPGVPLARLLAPHQLAEWTVPAAGAPASALLAVVERRG